MGAPIYFRQIQVGEVVSYELAEDTKTVNFRIFINEPHDSKVRENSRFWNASGIDVNLSAAGFNVEMESIVSLVSGGLAFEVPPDETPGENAPEDKVFTLYSNREAAFEQKITVKRKYLLSFDGSVRGLTPGAEVEFRGIDLGVVKSVDVEFDPETKEFHIPVLVEMEPERMGKQATDMTEEENRKIMDELVARGLRAQLKTGSILTGKLYIDLDFFPDAEKEEIRMANGYPVMPTVPTSIEEITKDVNAILGKVKAFPFEQIGENVNRTTANLNKTILQAEEALKSIDNMFAEDSVVSTPLLQSMRELAETARSLRILADYLERHPEALLRGKEK